jgi:hypothetical protein
MILDGPVPIGNDDRSQAEVRQGWTVSRRTRWIIAGAIGVAVLAGLVFMIWLVPPALYHHVADPKTRTEATASTRTALIAAAIGLGAFGSLAVNTRVLRETQRANLETQRANTLSDEREREAQITDRYTKAIEQLGSKELAVRIGGIYALERLTVDSDRDHGTITEVLCALVRSNRPGVHSRVERATEMPADIQAALTVLGRPPRPHPVRGPRHGGPERGESA